ncbi:integrator complex subunit 3 [Chrysoperla carnea]|uniref:integrator complex subunit 3 n=1 Tax=Chrysoperla carnea TaxID=189513 RepID=UPI001D07832C|nr:integrator complex subunit 3 [Chrysoperla carnea]
MEQTKNITSRLFQTSVVENKDDIEEKLERSYNTLQNLIKDLSEKEAHDVLNNAVCKDKSHEEISLGLLVVILTEPKNAAKSYRDLTLITRDGLQLVLTNLSQLILDRFLKFHDIVRTQLLWLVREMIRNAVANVDNLCWNLMRHAAGGDVSPRNISLVDKLLDIYQENRAWLDKFPVLIASVVYTYLRLIEDHSSVNLIALRQKETIFMVNLIRERFADCILIGRDFVRLLQNVARLPEFEQLWKDILLSPKSLCPSFSGVLQLLQTRTSRRFLQSRLTPDMERKLVFLTSQVRFGNHKRYQDWFQRQYLATPESQSLRCDMIRFIVGVIHPTNELLCSDIIPRWAVIGWLLTTCTSTVAVSNAKLALFYDWLFFEPDKDNIMNIEPAILVMYNSMRSHPAVSATLLDFLCRIIPNFCPSLVDKVRAGIFSSLRQILEKRVLPVLSPLFDSPKLDRELRAMVRETFKEFCSSAETSVKTEDVKTDEDVEIQNHLVNNHKLSTETEPAFSDEEDEPPLIIHTPEDDTDDDDIPLAKVRLKEKTTLPGEYEIPSLLEGDLRSAVERLQTESDNETRCQAMESIVQQIIEQDFESEVLSALSNCLCNLLREKLTNNIFPEQLTDDNLQDSIGTPLFVMFRNLYQMCREDDRRRQPLVTVLAEMYLAQPRLGYYLLYFLKVWTDEEVKRQGEQPKLNVIKAGVYKDFCQGAERKLDVCLLADLELCSDDDMYLLLYIVPDVYRDFKPQTLNNIQILRVVVSVIDARQLQDLVCHILQGKLVMFKNDSIQVVLEATLEWETFEQFCVWQLISAHDVSIDLLLPLLPKLEFKKHPEAITSLLLMLKQKKPNAELIKTLFSRDVKNDSGDVLVLSTLKFWSQDHTDILGDLISNLLSTRYPATSPNKRKRTTTKNQSITSPSGPGLPTAEQVLTHLDQLRRCCSGLVLYSLENMQRALMQVQSYCTESQKKQFGDLFALAEEEEVLPSSKPRSSRGRRPAVAPRPAAKRTAPRDVTDSSENSSEEEEIVKPKQAKKRKKVVSDSD